MAKTSVLGHPNNVPRLAREGFNLNQVYTFTASTGMLLPVWYDLLNPGETIKGAPSFLLRSDAFLAPAMADVDCFCDLFFVPMQKILSPFGEWFYQIDDLRSDLLTPSGFNEYLPICTSEIDNKNPFSGMNANTFNDYFRSFSQSSHIDTFGFGLHRLMQHLGYNPQALFYPLVSTYEWQDEDETTANLPQFDDIVKNVSCPNFSPYLFCAYQGIYYDYYRNSEFEANNVKAYNLDSYFNGENSGEIPMDTLLDYSDPLKRQDMFSLRYRWRGKDYFTANSLSPIATGVSMLPNGINNLEKVNQWLTQGEYDLMTPNFATSTYDPTRPDSAFTQFGMTLKGTGGIMTGSPSGEIDNPVVGPPVYSLESGSVRHSTITNINSGALLSGSLGNDGGVITAGGTAGAVRTPHDHSFQAGLDLDKGTLKVGTFGAILTTARLRTMFALDKLERITARAGKHYDDQTLAHFGFKVNQGLSGEVYKIGSWHTQLGISKVVSTADTENAPLGEMAATGYAVLDARKKGFKFTAPCHGIVMCIWSCAPRYKYVGTVDKLGMKTKLWDFYKPSLDNLGKQPIFGYEFGGLHGMVSDPIPDYTNVNTDVEGWQWRFMESKVKYDRASFVFMTTSKNPWSMTAIATTYVCPFVSPADMNKLFNVEYDTQVKWPEEGTEQDHRTWVGNFLNAYLRDPFTIDFFMKSSKVSTMSTFGDLSLNGI